MPQSLRQLRSMQGDLLLLDAASSVVHAAWISADGTSRWQRAEGEAGTAVFTCVRAVLQAAHRTLNDASAFVFCDGPGSVLGVRTSAVAIRTWNVVRPRSVFQYESLALVATAELEAGRGRPFSVIADARRETWHRIHVSTTGTVGPLERVATSACDGTMLAPLGFRSWAEWPGPVEEVPYDPETRFRALEVATLFAPAEAPDAFLHEAPAYQLWTPQIHRAPS